VCTPTELSYEILTTEQYQAPNGMYTFRPTTLIDHNTTSALILNPIAAGLAGLGMLLACIAALVKGRVIHGVSPNMPCPNSMLTLAIVLIRHSPPRSIVDLGYLGSESGHRDHGTERSQQGRW
jgi:hypothetical protein